MLDNQSIDNQEYQTELARMLESADAEQRKAGLAAIMGFLVGLGVKHAASTN